MGARMAFAEIRTDDSGDFDELIAPKIHMEMMSEGTLWIGLDGPKNTRRIMVVITAVKRGKLLVTAEDDSDV